MNQQNINNLIAYFKQNLTSPPQTLINNCLKSGYLQEDINEAVKTLQEQTNSSQTPSAAAQQPTNHPSPLETRGLSKLLVIVLIIAVILLGVGIGLFLELSGKNISLPFLTTNKNQASDVNQKVIIPSPKQNIAPPSTGSASFPISAANPPQSDANPLTAFANVFNTADFKISTSGRVENKQNKTDEKGNPYSSSSAMDLNNTIVYVREGKLVRFDSIDPQRPQISFLKENKIYSLNQEKKTYNGVDIDTEMGKSFYTIFTSSFPLITLIEDQSKTPFTFEKAGESQWQTAWMYKNILAPEESKPIKIKITLDPTTSYITTLSFLMETGQSWQDLTFVYENISNLDSLLTVPPDYTEEISPY